MDKLSRYAMWKPPTKIDFSAIVKKEVWEEHHTNWGKVLSLLQESQKLAKEIRETIEAAPRHTNFATGEVTYGKSPEPEEQDEESPLISHEEAMAELADLLQAQS